MEITPTEFKDSVFDYETKEVKNKRPIVVDLFTDWCASCKALSKPLDNLALKYKEDVDIVKVDITQADSIASAFDIQGVPTFLFFRPGQNKPTKTITGGTPVSLDKAIALFVQGE